MLDYSTGDEVSTLTLKQWDGRPHLDGKICNKVETQINHLKRKERSI